MKRRKRTLRASDADINTKPIALDDITVEFLKNFRTIRKKLGLTQNDIARASGSAPSNIISIEKGSTSPTLFLLIKLAEILQTDISESINYKFFYRQIRPETIKEAMRSYGLSYIELSQITGYERKHISLSVRLAPKASLKCLYAVLQAIHREKAARAVVDSLTHSKGGARFTDTKP